MLVVVVKRQPRRSTADRVLEEKEKIALETHGTMSTGRWVLEWAKSIIVAFALFLVIRTFLVEAFRIPTGSMEDTLLVGDFLLVNKAIYGARIPLTDSRLPAFDDPERGDVVVFIPPLDPDKNYVKRLVAVPGDTVEMHDKRLFIDHTPVNEPYARYTDPNDTYAPGMFWQCDYRIRTTPPTPCRPTRDNWGPLVVPPGAYMMLGDNRDDSEDSRYWGFVKRDVIEGTPLFIYYSFDPSTLRPLPWLTEIRWGRIGHTIR